VGHLSIIHPRDLWVQGSNLTGGSQAALVHGYSLENLEHLTNNQQYASTLSGKAIAD